MGTTGRSTVSQTPVTGHLKHFNIARKYFSVSMQKGTFKSYFVYISSTLKKIF